MALREGVLQRIGAVVAVQLFGSAATGLDLPTSDLDIVICGPEASGRPHEVPSGLPVSRGDLVADLREVAKALIAEGVADASRCEVIAAAKVPLVRFVESRSGVPVDLVCWRDGAEVAT